MRENRTRVRCPRRLALFISLLGAHSVVSNLIPNRHLLGATPSPQTRGIPAFRTEQKKKKRSTVKRLSRMISCLACRVDDASPNASHRLRSGAVELLRFERTTGQTEEFYAPCSFDPVEEPMPSPSKGDCHERYVERLGRMSGIWMLERSRSDALTPMCQMLDMHWMIRKAMESADLMQVSPLSLLLNF